MNLSIATWNVNSVRPRMERVAEFLRRWHVDVLCIQELKCRNEDFPQDAFDELGYNTAVNGQKTYNGVAIVSRLPINDVRWGMADADMDSQARLISAEIAGVRIYSAYVPNGADMESDRYGFKLRWLERLREFLDESHQPDEPLVLCGDTNVIIHDDDAHEIVPWRTTGLACDQVRRALRGVTDWGLVDVFRTLNPQGRKFTWWDYRQLGFVHDIGLRLDHILASAPLAEKLVSCEVDRETRKGTKPSDHAAVVAEFKI